MEPDNYECPICLSIILEPIRIKCSHVLCLNCLEKLLIKGKFQCPLDRKPFDMNKDLTFDNETLKKCQKDKDFEKHALELLKARNKEINNLELVIKFGNEHKEMSGADQNKHRWEAFVTIEKTEPKIKNLIAGLAKQAGLASIFKFKEDIKNEEMLKNIDYSKLD